jgi:outer membrane protein OmpA-like peptidoglycan-associated protein
VPERRSRRGETLDTVRIGERPVLLRGSAQANSRVSLDQQLLRTRGGAAANRRGMRRVTATQSGVQVFMPSVVVPGPVTPSYRVYSYPAYSGSYYYGPNAVFVEHRYVDSYMDRQYVDLEASFADTGVTVERRGDALVIMLPADVTFAFDRSEIRPRFFGVLNAFAETLRNYPGSDVEVVGHTDSVGSETYNLALSERRGRTVAEYLVARGVEPARLTVEAMGESEPIASNATAEGRAANRRVELIIHPRAG